MGLAVLSIFTEQLFHGDQLLSLVPSACVGVFFGSGYRRRKGRQSPFSMQCLHVPESDRMGTENLTL
jgi:hypothetical protein